MLKILLFVIIAVQCSAQKLDVVSNGRDTAHYYTTSNRNFSKLRWNQSDFWRSNQYLKNPDKRFLDWKNYANTLDVKQFTLFFISGLSGIAHGMREAYHADPYVFETGFGSKSESFFGSDAWKLNYFNNDPNLGHKSEIISNFGRDIWHTADKIDLVGITFPMTLTGLRSGPKKYRALNAGLCIVFRSGFSFLTYKFLRER